MNTTYFLNLVAGNVMQTQVSPAIPSAYYIGLSSTAPAVDGTGATEPDALAGYNRLELADLSTPTDGVITNTKEITFDESLDAWGVLTHFVIYDAATGGNLLMYGELTAPRTVETGTIMIIRPDALKLSVVNPT